MKWLALFLMLGCAASAQIIGDGRGGPIGVEKPSGGPPTCTPGTQATNYAARLTSPTATETYATCTLINYFVAQGVITGTLSGATGCGSHLDLLYLFAFSSTTNANLNVCGTSYGLTKIGSVTLTNDQGYTGDGSTGYFTTGFTSGNMQNRNAGIGGYVLTNTTTTTDGVVVGSFNGTNYTYIGACNTGSPCTIITDIQGSTFNNIATSNSFGFIMSTRPDNANPSTLIHVYKGSTLLSSPSDTSTGGPSVPLFVLGLNANNGGASNFDNHLTMAVVVGGDLTSLESVIYTGLNAYCTNMGISPC